jgi:hypothetical protein
MKGSRWQGTAEVSGMKKSRAIALLKIDAIASGVYFLVFLKR